MFYVSLLIYFKHESLYEYLLLFKHKLLQNLDKNQDYYIWYFNVDIPTGTNFKRVKLLTSL